MRTSTLSLLSFILLASATAFAQEDFQTRFKDLYLAGDTTGQVKLLKDWATAKPKDPELFIAYFNFYAVKSRKEVVTMDSVATDNNSFAITDSTTGKTVGYMNTAVSYDTKTLQQGFDYIDKGIVLHPTRLDMRFGKIYMLGQSENWPHFTKIILETIEKDNAIKHAWLWKEGKPLEDAVDFFLDAMQQYNATVYNTEDDALLPHMRTISEAVLKYHPTHVESLANIATTYLIAGEYAKALPYLLKAEKINPKDIVVLNNIAEAYKRSNDKVNAKLYYEKMIQYGNAEDIDYAKEKLKALE